MKVVKPKFSENGSSKYSVEQSAYIEFLDMTIFTNGKHFHKIVFLLFSIKCKGH